MRLVEVAKKLGMTGQELRHELAQVDFGVKATDREIADSLAQGIIRFLARKYNIPVEEEAPVASDREISAEKEGEPEPPPAPAAETPVAAALPPPAAEVKATTDSALAKKVHVLRKLSLDGVRAAPGSFSGRPGAPRRPMNKAEQEERRREQKLTRLYDQTQSLEEQQQIKRKEGMVELPDAISVKEFAEKAGVQVPAVIATLMKNGVLATINQRIDFDTASIVAAELGVQVKKVQEKASAKSLLTGNLRELLGEEDPAHLQRRSPIVTVMGHVDHGKTAILDAIRKTNVAAEEAGGITQKIGASEVRHETEAGVQSVIFLDTPGHEAFTAMRARGAQITDIVILVVAADEGVKPTTIEAINHARDAGVPMLVALNKVDKEGADIDRVKGELAGHGLQPEEWGGKTPVVACSAKTGQGIADLLDHVLILAEIADLRSNPRRPAIATVIESHLDPSLGPVASVIMNAGTLRIGDIFVCGATSGRLKSMTNALGARIQEVGPSGAVRIAGLSRVPEAGDILQVVQSEQEAKALMEELKKARARERQGGLGDLVRRLTEGKLSVLKIVLKADSQGSLEALQDAIAKLQIAGDGSTGAPRIAPKVIHAAVGGITEGDVMMAAASGGIVLGFNVAASSHVEKIAASHGVQLRLHDVIYALLEEVQALLQGLVEPEEQERILGHLEVRGVFFQEKAEQIIGGRVMDGTVKRLPFRVFRDGKEIGTGRILTLRHVEREIKEAAEGSECGMRVESGVTIAVGDSIEVFLREFRKKQAA